MTEEFMQYADQLRNQKLFELEDLYQKRFHEYSPIFQNHFKSTCETIIRLQRQKELGEISYLEYTLLYTSLIQKKTVAEIRVYDHNWYFDPKQRAIGDFDLSFLLLKYKELWNELMSCRKRFAGAVTAQETVAFLLSCANQFCKYIASVFRFSILECVESEPFLSIQRAEKFEINVGEYMAYTETIYKENQRRTSASALDWFSKRERYEYAFEDFTGLDFSGADLSEIDLRFSDLRRSTLVGTDFQDSMLFGTRFCYANLRDADFRYCELHESDFTGADLTNARFTAAKAYCGVPDPSKWIITGYRPVSFKNANLTNADFTRTRIHDADFTGAILDGTIIQKEQLEQFALTPEQLQTAALIDS